MGYYSTCFRWGFLSVAFEQSCFLWANIGLKRWECCLFETGLIYLKGKLERGLENFF